MKTRSRITRTTHITRIAGITLASAFLAACAAAPMHLATLDQIEQVRTTPAAKESAEQATEAYAHAEQERALALGAHATGDDVGSTLHAERALAAYGHALAIARLARATAELADAQKSLDDAVVQKQSLDASRDKLEHEADALERRVQVARDKVLPATSGPAPAEREAARRTAARAMATYARLLCGAARLVAPDADGLAAATTGLTSLTQRLDGAPLQAPVDDAARARALCLDVLTRARRATAAGEAGADDLLAELSAHGGWDPDRDERGVVVTLRDAYRGPRLVDGANAKLKELGQVAAAHPTFALQVVVHDAIAAATPDDTDARRAVEAVQALEAGGATSSRVASELAGARVPVADPSDPRARARNERLEVVFVHR